MKTIPPACLLSEPRVLSNSRDRVGECPLWSVAQQALYWVDIEGRRIHRFDWASQTQQTWNTAEQVGCIALTDGAGASGDLLAAMQSGIFALTLMAAPALRATLVAAMPHAQAGMRCNDGRCDVQGRFWVSTLCLDLALAAPVGALYCLATQGLRATGIGGLILPNGLAFSPDGRTGYLSDSHASVQAIWAFDVDPDTGVWSKQRDFVDMRALPGRPDGAAVDEHGCYWICGNDAGLVHRFSPVGELLQSLPVPVAKPSMCAFGGPNLDLLFVTSILPPKLAPEQAGLNGAVWVLQVGVRGLPEPRFSRYPANPSSALSPAH